MSKPKAKATKPVPSNPKVTTDATINNQAMPSVATLMQAAEHMHRVAATQATLLGISYPANVQWTFSLKGESDTCTVKLLSEVDGLADSSELRALAIVTVPWSAWDATMTKAADALINRRIQFGLYKLQCALIDKDKRLDKSAKTVAKAELRVAIGFEPSKAALDGTEEGSAQRQALFDACQVHRASVADAAFEAHAKNPIGSIARQPVDPAQLSVSPAWECVNGCYKANKVFESERLPNVKNVPFFDAKKGAFCSKTIEKVAKSVRLECQHCKAQGEYIDGGTKGVIEKAQAKLAKLMRRINGLAPEAPAKSSENGKQRHEAKHKVALRTAKHYEGL